MNESGIIAVLIERSSSGLYTATSSDLDGVYVANRDLEKIIADIPAVITNWFKTRRKMDVKVLQGPVEHIDGAMGMLASAVPVEIAARALAR